MNRNCDGHGIARELSESLDILMNHFIWHIITLSNRHILHQSYSVKIQQCRLSSPSLRWNVGCLSVISCSYLTSRHWNNYLDNIRNRFWLLRLESRQEKNKGCFKTIYDHKLKPPWQSAEAAFKSIGDHVTFFPEALVKSWEPLSIILCVLKLHKDSYCQNGTTLLK